MFRKAERKKAKLRLALTGPSGSGKTYSALLIAKGLCPDGEIAVLDSENNSAELYADLFPFRVAPLSPPYSPESYIQAIKAAEEAGIDVLIIDSLSHCWNAEGGLLEIHQKATQARWDKNSFAAWSDVTPRQLNLINAILRSPIHIITTLRTKVSWEVVENDRGKKQPIKVGTQFQFREGFDYEMTVVLDLSTEGNVAISSKDRTNLFNGKVFTPSQETGTILREWLESGIDLSEASGHTLLDLKKKTDQIDMLPELKEFWRRQKSVIDGLLPEHVQELQEYWLSRKEAILAEMDNLPRAVNA